MTRYHNINGVDVPFTADEEAKRDAEEAAAQVKREEGKVLVIRAEAERRLTAGVVLSAKTVQPGALFKCDTESVARLQAMCLDAERREAAKLPVNFGFMTAAGVPFAITSSADGWAISSEQVSYAATVLAASAALQLNPPADPLDPSHWPSDGSA